MNSSIAGKQSGYRDGICVAFVHAADLYSIFLQYHLQIRAAKSGVTLIDRPVATITEQISAIDRLLHEDISVLLVRPIATEHVELIAALRKAQSQGIQLISIDGMPGGDLDICSVGLDNFGGQVAIAEYVFDRLGGTGKIAYFQGDLRTEAGDLRNKGVLSVLTRYPDIKLVYSAAYEWSSATLTARQALVRARAQLQMHPDIDAIISANDEGAIAVHTALEEMGLRGKIILTGFDGLPEGITALSAGVIEATARQPLEKMAQQAIDLAMDLARGRMQKIVHSVHPVELVTRATIGEAAMSALRIFPEVTEELNKRATEEKEGAAFLEALLDNMPSMLTVKDATDLRYVRVNRARAKWLKVGHESPVGKSAFDFYPADTAARFQADDRAVLESGQPKNDIEEQLVSSDTRPRHLRTRKIPIMDTNGKPEYLLVISDDITARKQMENALATEAKELEETNRALIKNHDKLLQSEKMAALGALVAGVAHELNTPIGNAVLAASTYADHTRKMTQKKGVGLTRAMLTGYLSDAGEGLAIMERNLQRAAELIQSFRQIAVDQATSQARTFLLDKLVSETLLALSPSLKKAPVSIRSDIPPGLLMDSYPGPLEQVLMNLINNAVTHGFEGRVRGQISLSARTPKPDWVDILVEDDGSGIAPENLRRIYDPFYTTKLGSGGAGLGLSVSRNIVTNVLGGSIEVSSTESVGTRFKLLLPLQARRS